MKLVVWASTPSFNILKNAFQKAADFRFKNGSNNSVFFSELSISVKEICVFIVRAFYEISVNIYYGMPNKYKQFDNRVNKELKASGANLDSINFFGITLELLKTKPVLHDEVSSLTEILKRDNPVLVIANHPYVPLDGFTIMSVVHKYRSDYSFIVNSNDFMHSIYPQFAHHFISVKMTGGPLGTRDVTLAQRMGVRALKDSIECLSLGQCVIIFPAGQGSKAKAWGDEIKDPEWLNGVGHIVKQFANNNKPLTVLPIFIAGHMGGEKNSQRYLRCIIESPLKLGAVLQQGLFNAPPTIDLHIGKAVSASEFKGMTTTDITQELRAKVYSLTNKIPIAIRS